MSAAILMLAALYLQYNIVVNNNMTEVDGVWVYQWKDELATQEQLDLISSKRKPVKILNSPASRWSAILKWKDNKYLVSKLAKLNNVRIKHVGETFINEEFSHASILARQAGLLSTATERLENITMSEFLLNTKNRYVALPISQVGNLQKDVGDLSSLQVGIGKPEAFIWMAHSGTKSTAHYDTAHNMNLQVVGRKVFYFDPAEKFEELQLYPSFHISRRQSQISNPDRLSKAIILEAGELLYIPPYYFHATATKEFGINVNCFVPSTLRDLEKEIMKNSHPVILDEILEKAPSQYPNAVVDLLFHGVSSAFASRNQCTNEDNNASVKGYLQHITDYRMSVFELGCEDFEMERCPEFLFGETVLVSHITKVMESLVGSRKECWMNGELEIILSDWVEAVLVYAVGFKQMCSFLQCLTVQLKEQDDVLIK